MKIAFVNDSCERLGVEYISAVLKQAGHEVRLFVDPQLFDDENISIKWLARYFDKKERLIDGLKQYKPDLIGISVVTDFYQWACQMARLIKQEMNVPIIFGGIHPTSVPERVIKNDFVDMVCVGEGEYAMLELLNSMQRGEIDYSIKNIWFKRDGKIIRNQLRPLIENLDNLPNPDKELFYSKGAHFSTCYYVIASRGCQYTCSYCCHSFLKNTYKNRGKYLRRRNIDNIIQELRIAKQKYRLKYVRFFDESLGFDKVWLREFSLRYCSDIKTPFICYMHPKDITPEAVRYLKKAGCCEIEMGVQSMSEAISFGVLNRYVHSKTIKQAIDIIKKEGISLVTDNIFGLPGQKLEDIIELARCYNQKRVSRIYFFWLRFYPRVKITEWAKDQGLLHAQQYEDIMDGKRSAPFSRGGDTSDSGFIKLQFLIFLISFLPPKLITWLIERRIYRYLPTIFSPAVLATFTSLFSLAFNDRIVHKKELIRYKDGLTADLVKAFRHILGEV